MTISQEQVALVTAGIKETTSSASREAPKVCMLDNSCYLVFSKVTVPSYRVLHIKKSTSGIWISGEAVLTLQGVDNNVYEVGTGDKYDEIIGKMFK